MAMIEIKRMVQAPKEVVWQVISDVEGYAHFAPNLSDAKIVSGSGTDMIRRCWDVKGQGWDEQCVLWDEGNAYSMVVDTQAEDYPYPIEALQGTWRLDETPDGTQISMRFEYTLKYGMVGKALEKLTLRQNTKLAETVIDNWIAEIEKRSVTA